LIALQADVAHAQEATARARMALTATRAAEIAMTREFHNRMLVAKVAVIDQYSNNSPAVQAIGLNKKSDYKRPARRAAPAPNAP